jgi:hypothetical protein
VDFDTINLVLIRYSVFVRYREQKVRVHQLFVIFNKVYDSGDCIVQHLNKFGITMKLVRLIKMCLNETYSSKVLQTDGILPHHYTVSKP